MNLQGKRAAIVTLGCKVNQYETDAMYGMLKEAGVTMVDPKEAADIYIVNTCSVTNMAERKSRQMLHRAKKKNPDVVVVAVGCYAQVGKDELSKDTNIDLIVGNNKKKDLIAILDEYYNAQHKVKKELLDINHEKEYEEMQVTHTAEHTRAYIKVQDGCNQFCSYCIIPYARGRVRSRNLEHVLEEVRTLAASGYKEVVLTGIHLSSYGIDTGENLLELIQKVHEIDGIKRIRLGSLEPRIITEEFASSIAVLPKMCPHFHLSLQSGCNATLKRMNRRYSAEEYMEKCDLLRKYFHNPALTTDVIVGFPGETQEEFAESMDFVDRVNFYETHIFKYSRRHGTKAAAMSGQLTEAQKATRSDQMLALNEKHAVEYEKSMIGNQLQVLLEEEVEIQGKTWYVGHSKEYIKTAVPKEDGYTVNDIVTVKADHFLEEHIITGEVL